MTESIVYWYEMLSMPVGVESYEIQRSSQLFHAQLDILRTLLLCARFADFNLKLAVCRFLLKICQFLGLLQNFYKTIRIYR